AAATVQGSAGARQGRAQGAGVGADRHRDADRRRTHGARPVHARNRRRRNRPEGRPSAGETSLVAGPGQGILNAVSASRRRERPISSIRRRERAAWTFVAPALLAVGLFFAIPVVSALLLSLTDFDIYALADLNNLRFVGLQNYQNLLGNPLFWGAMKN